MPGLSLLHLWVPSDPHAELGRLSLVAGMRVEVTWSAAVEFVAQTQLATHVESQRGYTHRHRRPSDGTQCDTGFIARPTPEARQHTHKTFPTLAVLRNAIMIAHFDRPLLSV